MLDPESIEETSIRKLNEYTLLSKEETERRDEHLRNAIARALSTANTELSIHEVQRRSEETKERYKNDHLLIWELATGVAHTMEDKNGSQSRQKMQQMCLKAKKVAFIDIQKLKIQMLKH